MGGVGATVKVCHEYVKEQMDAQVTLSTARQRLRDERVAPFEAGAG